MSLRDTDRRDVEPLRWDTGAKSDEAREIETIVSLLRSLPDPEPGTDLTARVMREVLEIETRPRLLRPAFGRVTGSRAAAMLAAGIACAAVGIRLQTMRAPSPAETSAHEGHVGRLAQTVARPNRFAVASAYADPRGAALFSGSSADTGLQVLPVAVLPGPDLLDRRLDAQLNALQLDPQAFFRRLERVQERDRFVQRLAERAARRGDATQVALNVRTVSHPLARPMADQLLHASLLRRVSDR